MAGGELGLLGDLEGGVPPTFGGRPKMTADGKGNLKPVSLDDSPALIRP